MVGIVNYEAGNIFSLRAALTRLGIAHGMINYPDDYSAYDRIIIPGVGHAGAAMQKLTTLGLDVPVLGLQKPVLGICVGMQLLTSFSEEGNVDMLDIFPLQTVRFQSRRLLKIPHMGWNTVRPHFSGQLFEGVVDNAYFYYLHSYFVEYAELYTAAETEYGDLFSASIQKDNFYGVQFHPEKSGVNGERILINFSKL